MKDKEKTELILNYLKNYYTSYNRQRSNVIFPELRLGSGYNDIAQRRIDLFIISSAQGNLTTAFEIKVSRADFLKDIKDNLKQRGARLYASNFYYVAPKNMIKVEEIPLWAGLIEIDLDKCLKGEYCQQITVPAPLHNRNNASWGLICSLVRNVRKDCFLTEIETLKKEKEDMQNKIDYLQDEIKNLQIKLHPERKDFIERISKK